MGPVPLDTADTAPLLDEDAGPARPPTKAEICRQIHDAAAEAEIPAIFFLRLIWQESRFDAMAVSHAGAAGVAQFMPKTALSVGLDDPFDTSKALPASARFLRDLHEQFGNLGLAAAAYNAGARRIREWLAKKGPLPRETRNYVRRITGLEADTWAKSAPDVVAMEMPPVPCERPDLYVSAVLVPMPTGRPGEIGAKPKPDIDVSAASKPPGTPGRKSAEPRHSAETSKRRGPIFRAYRCTSSHKGKTCGTRVVDVPSRGDKSTKSCDKKKRPGGACARTRSAAR
ncbi:MAG: lytic transglycosylase domain-containing protein [Rhizobiales bacterium]|nr:lytic transglycosylase domain-containing protein [Hyphomicrobiales bacterium]